MPPPTSEHTLDLCGERCPMTFVRTKLAVEELSMGSVIAITFDHEPASRNVPRSALDWGQEVLSVSEDTPGKWLVRIRRTCP